MVPTNSAHLSSFAPISANPEVIRLLVLKLRWIGMEDEAQEMSNRLAAIAPTAILADVAATD